MKSIRTVKKCTRLTVKRALIDRPRGAMTDDVEIIVAGRREVAAKKGVGIKRERIVAVRWMDLSFHCKSTQIARLKRVKMRIQMQMHHLLAHTRKAQPRVNSIDTGSPTNITATAGTHPSIAEMKIELQIKVTLMNMVEKTAEGDTRTVNTVDMETINETIIVVRKVSLILGQITTITTTTIGIRAMRILTLI